jgi:hypothetical protein
MSDDLTPADYAILLLLKIEAREISNTELDNLHGVRLVSPAYEKLNGGGYVDSNTDRRPYRHRLSPAGKAALEHPVVIAENAATAEKRSTREKHLWAALAATHRQNLELRAGSSPVGGGSLDERIRTAYACVAGEPGAWVSLTRIRPLFADVSKADLNKALEQMLDAPDVRLEPEVNRHRIDAREKGASVRIGGEDRHKMAIGLR